MVVIDNKEIRQADRETGVQKAVREKDRQFVSPDSGEVAKFVVARTIAFWETGEVREVGGHLTNISNRGIFLP